ncbi:hypothetical protein KCQ_05456 [Pectobacterium atrosepticum ICMP 1526]|uniref:hypothetical protein n=1 Tax=Pectobacterium atrosepticum TaxID=29471 RepID=UPI00050354C5|nr:hypothetical protein [Pectobacterium atrosepticum]KFX10731.1 hypothetical protein JV34_22710 [Pectobacterium atrosepticum]KMK87230.1 hypothetical protein KCQ_05456 [Pectobacterium atrosepticum ICMP 1526]
MSVNNSEFTYTHEDIRKQINKVVEVAQAVRDSGAAIFDKAIDWFSDEDKVKLFDTIKDNTKRLEKIDGLCNYISMHIDNVGLFSASSKIENYIDLPTDKLIEEYKKLTGYLSNEILRLEIFTTVLDPKIKDEKFIFEFVISDVKLNSDLIYLSLNSIERSYDMNNIRLSLFMGEDVEPKIIAPAIPRK